MRLTAADGRSDLFLDSISLWLKLLLGLSVALEVTALNKD